MAATFVFPDIGEPCLPMSQNCGSSFGVSIQDSTISTTSDGNYKHTRPRTTRMITTWTYAWNDLTDENKNKLSAFYKKVGTFKDFQFTDWEDGKTHIVRFIEKFQYQLINTNSTRNFWGTTLKFEEV